MKRLSVNGMILGILVSAQVAFGLEPAGADRWARPALPQAAPLPRLAAPLVLDGDLKEWSGGACIPIHSQHSIAHFRPDHKWKGPADCGLEAYAAWNDDGLCLAAVVADDEVINTKPNTALYEQDCVELYVDGRAPQWLMASPYTRGAYQLQVRPPTATRDAEILVNPRDGKVEDLRMAARRTATGYTIEVLVPWKALPGVSAKPGVQVGLQFEVDDYDARDGTATQPLKLSWRGEKSLWADPRKFIRWVLVDKVPAGPQVPLDPIVSLDLPGAFAGEGKLPISLEAGALASGKVGSVLVAVVDPEGKTVWDASVKPSAMRAPWQTSVAVSRGWPTRKSADGYYTVRAEIRDADGRPMGQSSRPVVLMRRVVPDMLSRIEAAKLGPLAQADPLRAAQYLAVGACVERLKRSLVLADATGAADAARETAARLDLAAGGKVAGRRLDLLDLLNLAADPEAQVAVQYPSWDQAAVTFYCGALPFATAQVSLLATEAEVARAFEPSPADVFAQKTDKVTVQGLEGRYTPSAIDFEFSDPRAFDPEKQVLIVRPTRKEAYAIDLAMLPQAQADVVTVLADCPVGIREKVEGWAREAGVPTAPYEETLKTNRVLVAGNFALEAVEAAEAVDTTADAFEPMRLYVARPVDLAPRLAVLSGNRLIQISGCASRPAAEELVRLIVAGRPLTASEADALRLQIVKDLAFKLPREPVPDGTSPCVGDMHMHTYYSDGSPSPVGLSLEAMYCFMDYAILAEHNTLDGALEARRLLARAGFAFPVGIGEEITIKKLSQNRLFCR